MSTTPTDPQKTLQSFKVCRDEVKHEYDILAGRLNSYMTSQAFLVSGYAISMNNAHPVWGGDFRLIVPLLLSLVGVVLSARSYPGIAGACRVIRKWHARQSDLYDQAGSVLDDYAVLHEDRVKQIKDNNLWFAMTAPWVFGITWILFAGLTVYLHTRG